MIKPEIVWLWEDSNSNYHGQSEIIPESQEYISISSLRAFLESKKTLKTTGHGESDYMIYLDDILQWLQPDDQGRLDMAEVIATEITTLKKENQRLRSALEDICSLIQQDFGAHFTKGNVMQIITKALTAEDGK